MTRNGKMYNYREVADYFGVSVMTVRRWRARKIIRATAINSKAVRFSQAEIDRLVREKTTA